MTEYVYIIDETQLSNKGTLSPKRKSGNKGPRAKAASSTSTDQTKIQPPAVITPRPRVTADLAQPIGRLPLCFSLEEVETWLTDGQAAFKTKAHRAYERRKLTHETRCRIDTLLNEAGATSVFTISNDRLTLKAWDLLRNQLIGFASADPELEFALITFICGKGGTSLDRPDIELRLSQERVKRTLRAMAPNWFGMTELGFFNSITHPTGGRHLQRHEHALIWGPSAIAQAKTVALRHEHFYQPNITDARRIDVTPVHDKTDLNLARLSAYLLKSPAKAMNWVPPRDGKPGFMNHSEEGDRYMRFLRLGLIRTMIEFEDLVFSGGQGQTIESVIVKSMRALAAADAQGKAEFHPDAIAAFCVEFAKELKVSRWTLPIIRRRA